MFNDGWRRADGSDDNRPNGTTISAQTHFAQTLGGESKIVRHVKCVRRGDTIVAFVWTMKNSALPWCFQLAIGLTLVSSSLSFHFLQALLMSETLKLEPTALKLVTGLSGDFHHE